MGKKLKPKPGLLKAIKPKLKPWPSKASFAKPKLCFFFKFLVKFRQKDIKWCTRAHRASCTGGLKNTKKHVPLTLKEAHVFNLAIVIVVTKYLICGGI